MSRARLPVCVQEPPGTEALRGSPRLFFLKSCPFRTYICPRHTEGKCRERRTPRKGADPQRGRHTAPSENASAPERGRTAPAPFTPRESRTRPEKAGEAAPAERGEAEFRYHFSLPKQFHSQCSLRYGDAAWCALLPGQRGPCAVQPRRPGPRSALRAQTRAALPPPPPPVRATPATKGARRASSERGRRRLLPTPLRHSVMSGFPVCAWERTLPPQTPGIALAGKGSLQLCR